MPDPIIVGGVVKLGMGLIDRLFPDKEAAAKAKLELLAMEQAGELKELEVRMSAIIAEAQSSDPWTSRARPGFFWLFYTVILGLVLIFPVIGVFQPDAMYAFYDNVKAGFAAIPEPMWWTFTTGFLGYAGARSFEKSRGVTK